MSVEIKFKQLFINGEFVDSVSGKTFSTVDPSTGKEICQVSEADAADVEKAATAAHEALQTWRDVTPAARSRMMHKFADLVEEHAETLAAIETMDSGKPLPESRSIDVVIFAECIRYYAGWTDKIYGQTIPSNGPFFTYTLHEPVGVVGAIIPWNFPLGMLGWKMGPALACGNTLVVKPAEQTPLSALYIAHLTQLAGFPSGVFNVLPGYGPTAGSALCKSPLINKIAFTGSGETGRIVQRACTEVNLKRCTLELGGKSANIVFADFDKEKMDEIVEACHQALFYNMGQVCCAGSRLFVQEEVYDEFVKKSVERAKKRNVGNPFNAGTEQGPQVDQIQYEKVLSYIEAGQKEGAKMECGGGACGSEGYFVQPTIFSDVQDNMRVAQEEIFGPVLCILKFKDADEVLKRANATPYGLAAAVWTTNIKTAQKMQRGLQAGTVWVNTYGFVSHVAPFGGFKDSGTGRDLGAYALQHYTEVKTVCSAL